MEYLTNTINVLQKQLCITKITPAALPSNSSLIIKIIKYKLIAVKKPFNGF